MAAAVLPGQSVTVRVPATSANLGPGFDTMGLALTLYDTVTVETLDSDELVFDLRGEGVEELPRDASHLVVRCIDAALDRAGYCRRGLKVSAENVIPHGRGLGSSASAIVSGVLAGNALLPPEARLDDDGVLQLASELEGHPDNIAPALTGALSVSWQAGDSYRSARIVPAASIVPVVAIPQVELSTETARAMLPSSVSHQSAAANSGRAALLVHALTADPSLLVEGTEDFLHQSYRAEAMGASAELMNVLRGHGHAAVISGAGPTVLVLADGPEDADDVQQSIERFAALSENSANWRVLRLAVDTEGAKVEMHRR